MHEKHAAERSIYTGQICNSEASIKTKSPQKRALSLLPEGNEIGCSFHIQEGGKTMKKLIAATTVTAWIALCAAVWARNEVIEKTPTPTPTVALCAAEATSANPGAAEGLSRQRMKSRPCHKWKRKNCKKANLWQNWSRNRSKSPPLPNPSSSKSRKPFQIPRRSQCPRRQRKSCSSVIWSMCRGSVGCHTKAPIVARTAQIFTKAATKSGSWGERGVTQNPDKTNCYPAHFAVK